MSSWATEDKRTLLHFSGSSLETFYQYIQASEFDCEAGGILLGSVHGAHLLIEHATAPTAWDDLVSDTDTPEEGKERTEAINDILIRASMSAKAAGNKPGSIPKELEIYIDKLVEPKLPWHRIINKYFNI